MQKCFPSGLGMWIAFEAAIDPGSKSRDLAVAVDRCQRAGATWVALRAGAGGANDKALSDESIAAFVAAGIDVYVWIFAYPNTAAAEIAGYKRWFIAGAKGAIINAEFPYQPATADEARALVAGIRTAWVEAQGERVRRGLDVIADEAFVGHAPPDYLGAGVGHALSDELLALDEVCDAIMPQVYAWEHNDEGHVAHVNRVMAGYAKRKLYADKVWCVGCTYRPKTRGGKPTPPMLDEAQRIADDVLAFLDNGYVRACPAPSLYTLDAITWINGPGDRVMSALELRARTIPAPESHDPDDTLRDSPTGRSSMRLRAINQRDEQPTESFDVPGFLSKLAEER